MIHLIYLALILGIFWVAMVVNMLVDNRAKYWSSKKEYGISGNWRRIGALTYQVGIVLQIIVAIHFVWSRQ